MPERCCMYGPIGGRSRPVASGRAARRPTRGSRWRSHAPGASDWSAAASGPARAAASVTSRAHGTDGWAAARASRWMWWSCSPGPAHPGARRDDLAGARLEARPTETIAPSLARTSTVLDDDLANNSSVMGEAYGPHGVTPRPSSTSPVCSPIAGPVRWPRARGGGVGTAARDGRGPGRGRPPATRQRPPWRRPAATARRRPGRRGSRGRHQPAGGIGGGVGAEARPAWSAATKPPATAASSPKATRHARHQPARGR